MDNLDFLKQKFDAGNVAHAYIFSGQNRDELTVYAKDFAKYVSKKIVRSDLAIERGQFPDVMMVNSSQSESSVKNEKDMMEIDIGQIRGVQNFLSYKSYYGGYKVVIVEDAERMNVEAQNCFLKNLEEPKGNTIIILLSRQPELLLPTITSRCQVIKFLQSEAKPSSKKGELSQDLATVLRGDMAEKFQYAKAANLEGENFQNLLTALANHFRNLDIVKYRHALKLILDLERQDRVSNINKKLALEILLLEVQYGYL